MKKNKKNDAKIMGEENTDTDNADRWIKMQRKTDKKQKIANDEDTDRTLHRKLSYTDK